MNSQKQIKIKLIISQVWETEQLKPFHKVSATVQLSQHFWELYGDHAHAVVSEHVAGIPDGQLQSTVAEGRGRDGVGELWKERRKERGQLCEWLKMEWLSEKGASL